MSVPNQDRPVAMPVTEEAVGEVKPRQLYLENKIKMVRLELHTLLLELSDLVAVTPPLPPELLSRIFLYCVLGIESPSDRRVGLLAITHVCRQWRSTALGYGRLWTIVDDIYCHPGLLEAALQRSGKYLLDVTLLNPSKDVYNLRRTQSNVTSIVREAHRIVSLTAQSDSPILPPSLATPQLRTLCLEFEPGTSFLRIPWVLPLLRSPLSLTRCTISEMPDKLWTELAVCRSLEVLCISRSRISANLKLVEIRDVLNNLPRLRELELPLHRERHYPLQLGLEEDINAAGSIHLPNIRQLTLRLEGAFRRCTLLLPLLVIRPDAVVSVKMSSDLERIFDEGLEKCVAELSIAVSSLVSQMKPFVKLDVTAPRGKLQVNGWTETGADVLTKTFTLIFPANWQLVPAVCGSCSSGSLATVSLDSQLPMKEPKALFTKVARFINSLPNMHNFILEGCDSDDTPIDTLINAFYGRSRLRFAQTQVLDLRKFDLRPCSHPEHDKCKNCLVLLQSALKQQLSSRRKHSRLSSLRIHAESEMKPEDLQGLLEIADEVYYDCMGDSSRSHRLTRTGRRR